MPVLGFKHFKVEDLQPKSVVFGLLTLLRGALFYWQCIENGVVLYNGVNYVKFFILSNQMRSLSIFWRILIKNIIERKWQIYCCAPEGDLESEKKLRDLGAVILHCNLDRKGLNPIKDFLYYIELKKIFKSIKPDILFATTIKPVIYGCAAAHSENVKGIFPTITGLGYVFEGDNFLKKVLMKLAVQMYAKSLSYADAIFFQNKDDEELFRQKNILSKNSRIFFARGTGVDTQYFSPQPLPPLPPKAPLISLLIGRLLIAKGIGEYAEAAKIMKQSGINARFQLMGFPEEGKGSLPLKKIEEWQKQNLIEYLGQSSDVRPYIANSHVAVLPSWREGVPTSLMEAMSMGRACVASDVPGCREVVSNGVNGWLVESRNPQALAKALYKFFENPDLVVSMGDESRKMAINYFDANMVANSILKDIEETMKNKNIVMEAKDNDKRVS